MRKVLILLFLALSILTKIRSVHGYDNAIIHPTIAQNALALYNETAQKKLTDEQVKWIMAGAIKEDADPRYLNHFYDYRSGAGFATGLPADKWAQLQPSALGDFSENAILSYYRSGDERLAYVGVGHQLHVIEDMAVPAHVRNDPHNPDPYEKWCQKFCTTATSSIIGVQKISESIISLAKYTGNNFYSQDTLSGEIDYDDKIVLDGVQYVKKMVIF